MTIPANTRNGIGASGSGPNIWFDNGYFYVVVIEADFHCKLYKMQGNTILETIDLRTLAWLGMPLDSADDHYRMAVCVLPNGKILIAGNKHGDPTRAAISNNAGTFVGGFSDASALRNATASGNDIFAYDLFVKLFDGSVCWFTGQRDNATVTGRDSIMSIWRPGAAGFVPFSGTGEICICDEVIENVVGGPYTGDPERAYFRNAAVDRKGRLWLNGCWQWVAQDGNSRKDCWLIYTDDAVSFFSVSGHPVPIPFTYAQIAAVPNAMPTNQIAGSLTMSPPNIDSKGNPQFTVSGFSDAADPDNTPTRRRHYWTGSAWAWLGSGVGIMCDTIFIRGDLWTLNSNQVTARMQLVNQRTQHAVPVSPPGSILGNYNPALEPTLAAQGVVATMVPSGTVPKVYGGGLGRGPLVRHA